MIERQVTIVNPSGLHARPAALFVQAASRYKDTAISLVKGERTVDAKSILGVMSLGAKQGVEVTLRAEGGQEAAAAEALAALIQGGFGEK